MENQDYRSFCMQGNEYHWNPQTMNTIASMSLQAIFVHFLLPLPRCFKYPLFLGVSSIPSSSVFQVSPLPRCFKYPLFLYCLHHAWNSCWKGWYNDITLQQDHLSIKTTAGCSMDHLSDTKAPLYKDHLSTETTSQYRLQPLAPLSRCAHCITRVTTEPHYQSHTRTPLQRLLLN
jgi:hypothetical protein